MPVIELIASGFVVGAFVAIALRFAPRDELGRRRLPRAIDQSIGMYLLRRIRGRPTLTASDDPDGGIVHPTLDQILRRIGVPDAVAPAPAPPPAVPAPPPEETLRRAGPIPPGELVAAATAILSRPPASRGADPRPRSALAAQRWLAGGIAVGLIVLAGFAASTASRVPAGGVLSATGAPGSGAPDAASPASSMSPAATEPLDLGSPQASPAPTPTR